MLFDLDETLIHCKREEYYDEVDSERPLFEPEIHIELGPPGEKKVKTGFTVRPYAL